MDSPATEISFKASSSLGKGHRRIDSGPAGCNDSHSPSTTDDITTKPQQPICTKVLPTNWQQTPSHERLELSDMDHTMPKIYVQIAEVFELRDDSQENRKQTLSGLVKGLEYTLAQYPIMTGNLAIEEHTGRLWVTREQVSGLDLYTKDLSSPTYAELEKRDFPSAILRGPDILPKVVTEKQLFSPLGLNQDEGIFIATAQINFIPGGVILAVAVHHNCSDGPGCDGFLTTWAENSRAATTGAPFRPVDRAALDRSRLSAPSRPTATRWKQLDEKLEHQQPNLLDAGGPPPPPPACFKMPELSNAMWHFPRSTTEKLKSEANGKLVDGSFVSTYDTIMAALWKGITRSKIDLLNPKLSQKVVLGHAVNTRKKFNPPLSDRFAGNAVAVPRTTPTSIEDLLSSDISTLAQKVRASINSITDEYVTELPEWIAGLEDRRWITINNNSFMGMDLLGTSWQSMSCYEKHDFGFGLPKALRFPDPAFEGFVFVYPTRSGDKGGDEGWEVCVCLEKSCQERLLRDEEFLKFAQPRGL